MEVGAKIIVHEEPSTNIEPASSEMSHETLLMIENESLKKENVELQEMLKKKFEQELETGLKNMKKETKIEYLEKELMELRRERPPPSPQSTSKVRNDETLKKVQNLKEIIHSTSVSLRAKSCISQY